MITLDIAKVAISILATIQVIWFVVAVLEFISEPNEGNAGTLVGRLIILALVITAGLRVFGLW